MSQEELNCWRLTKFKFVGDIISGGTPESGKVEYWDGPVSWLTPVDLGKKGSDVISGSARTITDAGVKSAGLAILPPGSIVISTRAPIGSVGLLACEATTNQGCKALVPDKSELDSKFAYYFSLDAAQELQSLGLGTTFIELSTYSLKNLRLRIPSTFYQRRIAAYLDEQTAKIDQLMEMRRRQMELLKEQRSALIQQAVTRGLNPDAPMKDSGIPWLGNVPAHWEVNRGRFLVLPGRSSVKPGPFGTQLKTSDYVEEGIKVFNQETVISKDFQRGEYISPQKYSDLKEFEVQDGDLLLTTRGTIGRCGVVQSGEVKAIIHPCLMRVRFNPQLMTNEYAVAYIEETNLFLQQVNYMSNATTIEVIYSENFRQIIFPVPPIKEQQEIAAWISNPNDPVLKILNGYARQLTLLSEYRAALINECVTGQHEVS